MAEYNGWTNYETWCVNLWLSNDESLYIQVLDMAREADPDALYAFGSDLREFVDDLAERTCPGSRSGASFVCDLLGAALSEVDWREIAEAWLEDMEEVTQ